MVARGRYQVAARNTLRDYAMSRPAFFDRDVSQFGWSAVSPSRPAISQSVGRSGGQGKRTAARSHAQPRLCGEHGEHGEHWTLMAAATNATLDQAGCVGTSASGSHNPKPDKPEPISPLYAPCGECRRGGWGMSQSLTERYEDRIAGVLSCYDRMVITGTVPVICYAEGMTRFLYANGIRIFDYPQFAQTLRDRVRDGAASLAAAAGITIEHIAKSHIRKEAVVARVIEPRGGHPGLVHIISAMEACDSYRPWHDKARGKTFVRPDSGKCLHYYFYFMDAALGLIYLRVPTWSPFRLTSVRLKPK